MSTTTGPDLSAAAVAVENLMDDTVIFVPAEVVESWVLDSATLRLREDDPEPLYDGRCKVKPLSSAREGQQTEGGLTIGLDSYRIDIPIGSPLIPEGSVGTITSSRRFPAAVGQIFEVKRIVTKTLAVQASYAVQRRSTIAP